MCRCGCQASEIGEIFVLTNTPKGFTLTLREDWSERAHEHEGCELLHKGKECSIEQDRIDIWGA